MNKLYHLKQNLLIVLANERITFLIFILYYIGRIGAYTTFGTQWPITDKGFQLLRMLGAAYFALQTIRLGMGYLKEKHSLKQIMIMVGFLILAVSMGINVFVYGSYLYLTDLLIGFTLSHISLRKNLKVRCYLFFGVCIFIPLLCALGILTNLMTLRGETMRYALGFDYTTRISGIFGFATLYYCCLKRFDLRFEEIFMLVFSSLLINFLTDTRTYFFLELGFALLAIMKHYRLIDRFKKVFLAIETLFVHFMPLASIMILLLTLCYRYGGIFVKIDKVLSSRLSQVYADLINYGLYPFGVKFSMYGNGGSQVNITNLFGSNYVDAGFLQLLILIGFVPFIITIIMMYFSIFHFYQKKMHYELFISFIIVFLSMFSAGMMSAESVMYILMFYGLREIYNANRRVQSE